MPTFRKAAEIWFNATMRDCTPETQQNTWRMLETHVLPYIGDKKPKKIKSKHIIAVAERYRQSAPRSVLKLVQRIARIFDYAQARGWCRHNPATCVRSVVKQAKSIGFAWLPSEAMPEFCDAIATHADIEPQALIAFWLIAYTNMRRKMVLGGRWEEINFKAQLWEIPGERMKTGLDHTIPLSKQVMAMLHDLHKITGHKKHMFGCAIHRPIMVIYQVGYGNRMTLHGFRKTFSTHANEHKRAHGWTRDAIEAALAHITPGVRGVYNKAEYLTERREILQWYADEMDKWRGIDNSRYNGTKEQNTT